MQRSQALFPASPVFRMRALTSRWVGTMIRAQGYKTFFMLNSTEHEIFPVHKC